MHKPEAQPVNELINKPGCSDSKPGGNRVWATCARVAGRQTDLHMASIKAFSLSRSAWACRLMDRRMKGRIS